MTATDNQNTKNTMKNEINPAVAMQREMLSNVQDANNVLTSGEVSPTFQGHVFNMETGKHGIANLIAEILTDHDAVFAMGIENTELRAVAISASMYAEEIIDEVKRRFTAGTTRYPYTTVHQYLSVFMRTDSKWQIPVVPKVAKIKLSNVEDKPRKSAKPRVKWYLVQK